MAEDLTAKLLAYGIDYDDALDRFGGNAELYKKLALKYLADTHCDALQAAMEVADYDTAYSQAHSLKGVAGNLSFADLYKLASEVTEALRSGEQEAAAFHLPAVLRAHALVVEGLEAWQNGVIG